MRMKWYATRGWRRTAVSVTAAAALTLVGCASRDAPPPTADLIVSGAASLLLDTMTCDDQRHGNLVIQVSNVTASQAVMEIVGGRLMRISLAVRPGDRRFVATPPIIGDITFDGTTLRLVDVGLRAESSSDSVVLSGAGTCAAAA
jgi:hypothetical protein